MDNDIENQMTNNEIKKICCLSCAVYTSITVLCVIAIHAFYVSGDSLKGTKRTSVSAYSMKVA